MQTSEELSDIDTSTEAVERAAQYCENRTIGMEWCAKLIRALAAERDRLRAIVDRLPKTADGVQIFVGDLVWASNAPHPVDGKTMIVPFRVHSLLKHAARGRVDFDRPDMPLKVVDSWSWSFSWCYSTREAAEAARKASP